ncbi:MAG: hypothetical protein HC800_25060 [Phormidesmis sp. RL_2_1]|nr:hypothetical protein [Phormidesmis sp. RL_2_1]
MGFLITSCDLKIDINAIESQAIKLALDQVLKTVEGGFHARLGGSKDEVNQLLSLIKEKCAVTELSQDINISTDQLIFLIDSLNEVCHGIYIKDFEAQFRCSKREAVSLLEKLDSAYLAIENTKN